MSISRIMKAFRLALSFLLVPKLFLSLIFFLLLLSIVLVYGQLFLTSLVINAINKDSGGIEKFYRDNDENNIIRKIVYGEGKPRPELRVCRWVEKEIAPGKFAEFPPDADCEPDRLDVAVQIPETDEAAIGEYKRIFEGNIERLHICKTCSPDIVISGSNSERNCEIYSIWGLMLTSLVMYNNESSRYHIEAVKSSESVNETLGRRVLHLSGFAGSIKMRGIQSSAVLVMNIAGLMVIALWLALKAHRKVLDYFARNGALLPMVAATGQKSFYLSIWILTAVRVAAFLAAALPLTYFTLKEILGENKNPHFIESDAATMALWLFTIITGLSFATLIASIAELKHRHSLLSLTYRFIPLIVCGAGTCLWLLSFIFEGSAVTVFRNVLAALPVVGLTPILVAPILKPQIIVFLVHATLTLILFRLVLKHNSRWFAAHLEDL